MFKTALLGEVNGKEISLYWGKRYRICTETEDGEIDSLEGTYSYYLDDKLLLKCVNGGLWISFESIEDIIEL